VNENHKWCGSDEWREVIRDEILPWALGDVDLGDDVLEVGPGYGATTDVLATRVSRLTAVEIDEELASELTNRFASNENVQVVCGDATNLQFSDARFSGATSFTMLHHVPSAKLQDGLFAEVARVLSQGGSFVASDSLWSEAHEIGHIGDTYNPVDPANLKDRLLVAGFEDATVKENEHWWAAVAVR
jgi:ubiquinone/menaquinone biosynthesis C-methylase UbiE